jgi:hypothetical protein
MVLTGVGPWQVIAGYTTYPAPGYQYQWPGGPTVGQMREHAAQLVTVGQFPALAGVELTACCRAGRPVAAGEPDRAPEMSHDADRHHLDGGQ